MPHWGNRGMTKKVKLRDVTPEQFKNYDCLGIKCDDCPLKKEICANVENCWVNHKDLYSDEFLDQTIDIEVPDILTKEEHDYLEAVIKPITKDLKYISLSHGTMPFHYLSFKNKNKLVIGRIDTGIYEYKSIEKDYDYTLEELGL
jgi:hypothetical protein